MKELTSRNVGDYQSIFDTNIQERYESPPSSNSERKPILQGQDQDIKIPLSFSRRWATLVTAMLVMSISGTVYAYGSIQAALKFRMSLSQTEATLTLSLLPTFTLNSHYDPILRLHLSVNFATSGFAFHHT